jgi:hypothetical protein
LATILQQPIRSLLYRAGHRVQIVRADRSARFCSASPMTTQAAASVDTY